MHQSVVDLTESGGPSSADWMFGDPSVDGWNPANQLICSLSMFIPLFRGFIHPRWCRMSSINSRSCVDVFRNWAGRIWICNWNINYLEMRRSLPACWLVTTRMTWHHFRLPDPEIKPVTFHWHPGWVFALQRIFNLNLTPQSVETMSKCGHLFADFCRQQKVVRFYDFWPFDM